ncbi:TIGR04197 family type VII secretion effector [Lactococcus lactis]|uniref:TIGR04197 family type VII secretion effector n=1 Tax=Lactococcus lactis TaxID=1358 RepID=UPI001123CA11|nr:TIGR04197 family type VII secretion effector [Lactococcus lactis]TNU81195.1 TIGR04197 family type VII secretion effector [Lactococcus lactis subsp. lactis]
MGTGKIKSSTVEAQGAIAELTGLKDITTFQTIEFGESNIQSMLNGKQLANELMNDISKITSCVLTQANKFPELAQRIEQRDQADAKNWK